LLKQSNKKKYYRLLKKIGALNYRLPKKTGILNFVYLVLCDKKIGNRKIKMFCRTNAFQRK
jgi:hypothetical protein